MNQPRQPFFPSPSQFPQKIDIPAQRALFIEVDRTFYRDAAFLDDRILTPDRKHFWLPLAEFDRIAPEAPVSPAHYIFHHGHCGSTLLSRLVEAAPGVMALREPQILRTLSDLLLEVDAGTPLWSRDVLMRRLSVLMKLLGRRYAGDKWVIVKASSFCNDLGLAILQLDPNALATAIYVPLRVYIATMLGGPNTPRELRVLAPHRLRRLAQKIGASLGDPNALGAGQCAAMSWASEMLALDDLAALAGTRWKWVEFDALLRTPGDRLGEVFAHFGITVDPNSFRSILEGSIWRTYSKAPEYEFDRGTRQALLSQYARNHAAELRAGVEWLAVAAARHKRLADLLPRM